MQTENEGRDGHPYFLVERNFAIRLRDFHRIGGKGRMRLRNRNPLMAAEKSGKDGWKDEVMNRNLQKTQFPGFRFPGYQ